MRPLLRLLLVIVGVGVATVAAAAPPLTVFAAASLKETLDEAGARFSRTHATTVRASYAATSTLARQVDAGAPADVFIAADAAWMDALQRSGGIDPRSRGDVASNELVLVAPLRSRTPPIALRHGVDLRPALGPDGRLALALTASVPAGRYAKASLVSLGAWDALRTRVVEAENVRVALQLVARREAPLGVVYASDAAAEQRVRVVARFPASTHPRIVYPAARVATSRHRQAAAFVDWLRSAEAQAIFRRHGFAPP